VAGETDLVSLLLEQEFRNHAMPPVAVLALSLFDNGMDVLHAEVFIRKFLVTIQTLLAGKPSLRVRSLSSSQCCLARCGGRFGARVQQQS